jgi:hypothetical protein
MGALAIKSDAEGHLLKLVAGGLRELECDGKPVVTLSAPSDAVLLRDARDGYRGNRCRRGSRTGRLRYWIFY